MLPPSRELWIRGVPCRKCTSIVLRVPTVRRSSYCPAAATSSCRFRMKASTPPSASTPTARPSFVLTYRLPGEGLGQPIGGATSGRTAGNASDPLACGRLQDRSGPARRARLFRWRPSRRRSCGSSRRKDLRAGRRRGRPFRAPRLRRTYLSGDQSRHEGHPGQFQPQPAWRHASAPSW